MRYRVPVSVMPRQYMRCYRIPIFSSGSPVAQLLPIGSCNVRVLQYRYLQNHGYYRSGDSNSKQTLYVGIIQTLIAQVVDKQHLLEDLSPWVSAIFQ
jgi:hypothetical protein